jgi:hypothetical protein
MTMTDGRFVVGLGMVVAAAPWPAVTWDALRALWDERDNRYRYRRNALGRTEVSAVRASRRSEVALLPPSARSTATAALNGWMPPVTLR